MQRQPPRRLSSIGTNRFQIIFSKSEQNVESATKDIQYLVPIDANTFHLKRKKKEKAKALPRSNFGFFRDRVLPTDVIIPRVIGRWPIEEATVGRVMPDTCHF